MCPLCITSTSRHLERLAIAHFLQIKCPVECEFSVLSLECCFDMTLMLVGQVHSHSVLHPSRGRAADHLWYSLQTSIPSERRRMCEGASTPLHCAVVNCGARSLGITGTPCFEKTWHRQKKMVTTDHDGCVFLNQNRRPNYGRHGGG